MNPSTPSSSTTSITSLPQEILLKILTGLPAKSAVGFRCTSKFFYSLIPEPRFAFKILVALPSTTPPALNLYSVSYREESHGNLQADTVQRLDVEAGLVCSADGKMCLLCCESVDEAVFDFSTGRCICLPSIGPSFSSSAVLGFDSVSGRYKVFKLVGYYDYGSRRVLNRLWVLTVGVDKSWREIDFTISGYTIMVSVRIHGIIYLICWTRFSDLLQNLWSSGVKIVAMDIATESFITSIPFPCEYRPTQHQRKWLPWMKLNDRLAFIDILDSQKTKSRWPDMIDIWTLEGSMKYWEKQTLVLPLEEREVIGEATFIGFTANSMGDIVFFLERERMMYPLVLVYSFGREVWRRFEIHGVGNYSFYLSYKTSVVYVEDEIATFLE